MNWIREIAFHFFLNVTFPVGIVSLLWFHLCFFLLLWSFYASHVASPPLITKEMVSVHPVEKLRYCKKCENWKLPRTHHCSMCGRCVVRMDHHYKKVEIQT
eukprot:TRINITY_DN3885_c0_g1_i26.p1 TRINITY_DN3885_c0_g1~~TRINITY_DN3885_c0_g1_i26.p1  ORF type:complete len:101 (-),score=9.86 TRINITY_DN3885_c0_g1_i26:1629-1931(-)